MGSFSVKVRVWNPAQPQEIEEFDARVDAHSTFSWISRARLERLGISPTRKMGFYLKPGHIVEWDMASVYVAIDSGPVGDVVVMAEAGEEEVIGAHTINGLGMVADLVQGKLVPTVMWALSSVGNAVPEIREKDSRALARS
jgi:predicted aspartyl protease